MIARVDILAPESAGGDNVRPATDVQTPSFDPLVSAAVEAHDRRQVARDIADANRRAVLDRQLLDEDLRVLDAKVRSGDSLRAVDVGLAAHGLGPADGLFRTAAPQAAMVKARAPEPTAQTTTNTEGRHDPSPGAPAEGGAARHGKAELPGQPEEARGGAARRFDTAPTMHNHNVTASRPAAGPIANGAVPTLNGLTTPTPLQGQGGRAGGGANHGTTLAHTGRAGQAQRAGKAFAVQRSDIPQAAQRRTIEDVVKVLRARHAEGRSVVKLRLTPPELGTLTVDIKMDKNLMTLRFETHSEAVRDLLQGHAAELSDALREQGVRIEQLDIEVKAQDAHDHGDGPADGRAEDSDAPPTGRPDAGDGTDAPEDEDVDAAVAEVVEDAVLSAGHVDLKA